MKITLYTRVVREIGYENGIEFRPAFSPIAKAYWHEDVWEEEQLEKEGVAGICCSS